MNFGALYGAVDKHVFKGVLPGGADSPLVGKSKAPVTPRKEAVQRAKARTQAAPSAAPAAPATAITYGGGGGNPAPAPTVDTRTPLERAPVGQVMTLGGVKGYKAANGQWKAGEPPAPNFTETVLRAVSKAPPIAAARGLMNAAGDLMPEQFGPLSDAGENAIRAVTGDRRQVDPQSYTSTTRTQLADAIDRATTDPTMKIDDDGFTAVDYKHYNKDGGNNKGPIAYVGGRIWAKKGEDGQYQIKDNEMYDFNSSGKGKDYKANLDQATQAAWDRGDFKGWLANLPDHLAYHTGAGSQGMNIGGTFSRPGNPAPTSMAPAPSTAPQPVQETAPSDPATNGAYTVQQGDTLTQIAQKQGTSVAELMRKNSIRNANIINIGQQLKY